MHTHTQLKKVVYFAYHLNGFILHIIQLIDYSPPMFLAFIYLLNTVSFFHIMYSEEEEGEGKEEEERDGCCLCS